MIDNIFNTLLPAHCFVCRKPAQAGLALCRTCHKELPYNRTACHSCAQPLSNQGLICGQCQQHPPHHDLAHAPLLYKDDARQLILELKFQEKLRNARLLAQLFHERLPQGGKPGLLIPVPLHPKRLRERGYNQSLEIARELARLTGITIDKDSAQRGRHTERQADLPLKDKKDNVKNAFEMTRQPTASHIAIVDDVMTSGHTVNEFARVLKKSGVSKVDAWVMARAG